MKPLDDPAFLLLAACVAGVTVAAIPVVVAAGIWLRLHRTRQKRR